MVPKLSVILATHSENEESYLARIAQTYPHNSEIEYIVVDHDTSENFWKSFNRNDFKIIKTEAQTRAERLSEGLEKAKSSLILFHHPRSILSTEALQYLLSNKKSLTWGGFTHCFDKRSLGLRFTSWYSNKVRPRTSSIVYLDHCIYFQKHLLIKKIPPIPIFEDSAICKILRKSGKPSILPFTSTTSSIRFQKNGFLKQSLKNQILKVGFHLGVSTKIMNRFYENKLNLN